MSINFNLLLFCLKEFQPEPTSPLPPGSKLSAVRYFQPECRPEQDVLVLGTEDQILGNGGSGVIGRFRDGLVRFSAGDVAAVLNRALDVCSTYTAWTHRCRALQKRSGTPEDLVSMTGKQFCLSMFLLDLEGIILEYEDLEEILSPEEREEILQTGRLPEGFGRALSSDTGADSRSDRAYVLPDAPVSICCKPLVSVDGTLLGTILLLSKEKRFLSGAAALLDELGEFVCPVPRNPAEPCEVDLSYFRFVQRDEEEEFAQAKIEEQLTELDWDKTCPKRVVLASFDPNGVPQTDWLDRIRSDPGMCAAFCGDDLMILLNEDKAGPGGLKETLEQLLRETKCRALCSYRFRDLEQWSSRAHEVVTLFEDVPTTPETLYFPGDIRLYRMYDQAPLPTEDLIHPGLHHLKVIDHEQGSEFYRTLFTFLRFGEDHEAAARSLDISQAVLKVRLGLIRTLVQDYDLSDRVFCFYLLFSFLLDQSLAKKRPDVFWSSPEV